MTSISRLCFRATTCSRAILAIVSSQSSFSESCLQDFWDPISKRFRALLRDLIEWVSVRAAIHFDTSKICRSPCVGVTHRCVCFVFGFSALFNMVLLRWNDQFLSLQRGRFLACVSHPNVQTLREMGAATPASGRQRSLSSLAWKRTLPYCTSLSQLWCCYSYSYMYTARGRASIGFTSLGTCGEAEPGTKWWDQICGTVSLVEAS